MRAMTFERLVRHERFVSELLTTAVGALGLDRPTAVRRVDGKVSPGETAAALEQAHLKAVQENQATMLTGLAVPFVGMEHDQSATPVKPDFAIVAPRPPAGSWLIMGDAKDYERVRSRIDDQRMLKGFLQVALGAESAAEWSALPSGMTVHRCGALAVPRNAFLQPEAIVETLDDHRREVRVRAEERKSLLAKLGRSPLAEEELPEFVEHLEATFDPVSCASCALFNYCRDDLRSRGDVDALLIELGIRPELRPAAAALLDGTGNDPSLPVSVAATINASVTGQPQWTGQRRIDPVGADGTINVVIAKADSAALGVHGIGIQRKAVGQPAGDWSYELFADPQSPQTRLLVLDMLGQHLQLSLSELGAEPPECARPIHIVVPDTPTADLLVSIADSLAGVETSRLRWQRDLDMGRPALTFNGEPAVVPEPLSEAARLAVSFLLEADRGRAQKLRQPLVDLRAVLARHVIPGGPASDQGRLDYLVDWAQATTGLDHRVVSDDIAGRPQTPGARLANATSDAIHAALRGPSGGKRDSKPDLETYNELVRAELEYKMAYVDRAAAVLDTLPRSRLMDVYQALEADAQDVWRRRLHLHASDLVRFGRTSWVWRNSHVDLLDTDSSCTNKLTALANPLAARELAMDAAVRELALATVGCVEPLRLEVQSRRIRAGTVVALLHINNDPCVEAATTGLKVQKGSFKFSQLSIGELLAEEGEPDRGLRCDCAVTPPVSIGDTLIVADMAWFGGPFKSGHEMKVERPDLDTNSAPTKDCHEASYEDDPDGHRYCCRSHELAEAEWADELAGRRERGELNPRAWPPIIDEDEFDTPGADTPTAASVATNDDSGRPAEHLTLDDLD
jgi:hypothetical protein